MDFKQKCEVLKSVRRNLADKLEVELHQKECTYQGECKGTCFKCKQEEETLNLALLGRTTLAATLAVGMVVLPGCTPNDENLMGLMEVYEPNFIIQEKEDEESELVELFGDIVYMLDDNEIDEDGCVVLLKDEITEFENIK